MGVDDDDNTGLLEPTGDIVGGRTGGETASSVDGTGLASKREHGAVIVLTAGDDRNFGRVLESDNGSKDTSGEDDLLPFLADTELVDTVSVAFVDLPSHLLVGVLGSDVRLQ